MNRFDLFVAQFSPYNLDGNFEDVYFKAENVAKILGYETTGQMLAQLKDNEKIMVQEQVGDEWNDAIYLTEQGFYHAIFMTNQPSKYPQIDVEGFRNWTVNTVLPSIAENGWYSNGQESLSEVEFARLSQFNKDAAASIAKECEELFRQGGYNAELFKNPAAYTVGALAFPAVEQAEVYSFQGKSYFSASDVARMLGYESAKEMLSRINEIGCVVLPNLNAEREPTVVLTEGAVYRAILCADEQNLGEPLLDFREKVFADVLSCVYNDGTYFENMEMIDAEKMGYQELEEELSDACL